MERSIEMNFPTKRHLCFATARTSPWDDPKMGGRASYATPPAELRPILGEASDAWLQRIAEGGSAE